MPKTCIDYSKCIIYKIVCHDYNVKDLYVGHTTDLVKRRSQHKTRCTNSRTKGYDIKIYKVIRDNGGWDSWDMTLIEQCKCENRLDSLRKEREYIELFEVTLNRQIPTRSSVEYMRTLRQTRNKCENRIRQKHQRILHKESMKAEDIAKTAKLHDLFKTHIQDQNEILSFV